MEQIAQKFSRLNLENHIIKSNIKVIHELLPTEILVLVLKKLSYESIHLAGGTCKYWREVIKNFELLKNAFRK